MVANPQVGNGAIILQGDSVTPANVVLSAAALTSFNAGAVDVRNDAQLTVKDLTLQVATSGVGLFAQNGGSISFTNLRFAACADAHVYAKDGAQINATGNYSIVGGAAFHWIADHGSQINVAGKTITLTGTPAFSNNFAGAFWSSYLGVAGNTYSGAATGKRFLASGNATIETFGGLTEFPGNVAGTIDTGGRHPALNYEASDVQIRSADSGVSAEAYVTARRIETASAFVGMVDAATIAFDWDAGINRAVTLAGNRVLGNPTNNQVGTWRTIWVVGDSATPRQLTFSGNLIGNTAAIANITSTSRYLVSVFALDSTFAWVGPPQGPF